VQATRREQKRAELAPLVAYIDARCADIGITRSQLGIQAGLGEDCIRKIAEGHMPAAPRLRAIADRIGEPVERLIGLIGQAADAAKMFPPTSEANPAAFMQPDNIPYTGRPQIVGIAPLAGGCLGRAADPRTPVPASVAFRREQIIDGLRGEPGDFRWAIMAGNAMAPELCDHDEVLIDCRTTQPIEPAIFAIDEGIGFTARWVEYIPGSVPPSYRVRCSDARFTPYDVAADRITIVGRIVWIGRRL